MSVVEIDSFADLKKMQNIRFGPGPWVTVTQEMINSFALATRDEQWIHTDPERAAKESPYGTTVAHGFLSLSMVSAMIGETVVLRSIKMGVNYGLNKVRFPSPVPVNSRVRLYCQPGQMEEKENGGLKLTWSCEVELENSDKPVCVCEIIALIFES